MREALTCKPLDEGGEALETHTLKIPKINRRKKTDTIGMQALLPSKKYREVLDITPVCTVDVLFFNDKKTKTLLFKRANKPVQGIYYSIGGRLLKGEKLENAAVRQARREAGVQVKKKKLVLGGVQEEIHKTSIFEGISYHAIDIFYGYVLDEEFIRLDSQHTEYKWFSVFDKKIHPLIKIKIASLLKAYGKKL